MRIIDLNLLEHSKEPKPNILINEAIQKFNLLVILGSPGSGKTSILKKYSDDNDKAQFLKIKKFIKLENQVNDDIEVLLLDGLDEYRSLSDDKTFVIEELANRLKALEGIKIVISCRELDWYGESDESALKAELDSETVVFTVQVLNYDQQIKMAQVFDINNPKEFIEKFSSYGFLDNPQMFKMIAKLYNDSNNIVFSSKAELYKAFIKGAKEQNSEITLNIPNQLSEDEILKYSGYLAFFYMFASVDIFEDTLINSIYDNERGFPKEKLIQSLNTTLFDQKTFIHRTVAEYALAYFLVNKQMQQANSIGNERIKALFIRNGKVPTELRGVYAWICSLSRDTSFIDIDPFYQAVYGDNSLFSEVQKKEIVLSVKKYAEEHPYFIDFWGIRNQLEGLSSLYSKSLDNFYIKELEEAKSLKNHYIYFIVSILNTSEKLSAPIKIYLKQKLLDLDIPTYLKDDILEVFEEDKSFLLQILNEIKDEKIKDDENVIKEFLLKRLYPDIVKPDNIVDYLVLYKKSKRTTVGHGIYLFKTQYENKFELAKSLLKLQEEAISKRDKNEHKFYGSDFMDNFISDFLYETILKYPTEMNVDQIHTIIAELREHVDEYRHLEFEPYTVVRRDVGKEYKEQFKQFSNVLYSTHIDKAIEMYPDDEKSMWEYMFNYRYFFPYAPTETFNILLTKMKPEQNIEINKKLFSEALTYIPFGYNENIEKYTNEIEQLKDISNKYGFDEILNFRLSKELPDWEKERRERDEKEDRKRVEILEKNEEYFSKRKDEEILTTFGDLKYISDLLYIGQEEKVDVKYLTRKTFERLKQILKELICRTSIDGELTTLDSLSKLIKRERYIEQVYYVSLSLNKFVASQESIKINEDILGYLYVNNLRHSNVGNIIKSNFGDYFESENSNKAIEILKEYIGLLINEHYSGLISLFDKYISQETEIKLLKRIAHSYESNLGTIQEDLLNNILSGYIFILDNDDLRKIRYQIQKGNKNKTAVESLILLLNENKNDFTKEMAVSIYDLLVNSNYEVFQTAPIKIRVKVIDYMFSVFNTEKSIEFIGGFQSSQSQCAGFLRDIVKTLSLDELQDLNKIHYEENNIWRNRILDQIDTLLQQIADQNFDRYPLSKIKEFALSNTVLSTEDFFGDVIIKLNGIKQEIEDNRNNEKNQFYNEDGSSKNEEHCRDVILQKLNDKYGYDIDSTKEKHEANNRVDINIKYKANTSYEVQVECKKDRNQDLYTGIQNQLIDKYFSSNVKFGVYLIFYFADKSNKDEMLKKIEQSVSDGYREMIRIVCIDLTK